MNKFKVGDTVRRKFWPLNNIEVGHVGKITKISRKRLELDNIPNSLFLTDSFELVVATHPEKTALRDALELINKHGIKIDNYHSSRSYWYKGSADFNIRYNTIDSLVEAVYPDKSPTQVRIEELEKQSKELADKACKLRQELIALRKEVE